MMCKHDNIEELTRSISEKYTIEKPGISIMAINNDVVIYNKQFGLANIEYDIPITSSTVFNIASISKQFTAMAIMMLEEKGYLDYDRELVEYLPDLYIYKSVTIRHMLNNTSGIENYYRILDRQKKSPIGINNCEVYKLLCNEKTLLFKAGSKFDYSNSNWVLLAYIIEKISGLSYSNYMKENIFDKIGMKNTLIFDESQSIVKNRAYGYKEKDGEYFCNYTEALTTGDGGVFSTIEDLYKWNQALNKNVLISKKNLDLYFLSGTSDSEEQYGFGWNLQINEAGEKIAWHTGLDAGFRCIIARNLSLNFTIIILSNSSQCSWEERKEITNKLYQLKFNNMNHMLI